MDDSTVVESIDIVQTRSGAVLKSIQSHELTDAITLQKHRIEYVKFLKSLKHSGNRTAQNVQSMIDQLKNSPEHDHPLLAGFIQDLEGQVMLSVQPHHYDKWGGYYLPSLAMAHEYQNCNNFKDPGVQSYATPLFSEIQEMADDLYVNLDPPTPSIPEEYRMVQPFQNARAPRQSGQKE
ncbi:hypothetical protein GEMRC1_011326 [Eukaryota sp. GEM-RC1]